MAKYIIQYRIGEKWTPILGAGNMQSLQKHQKNPELRKKLEAPEQMPKEAILGGLTALIRGGFWDEIEEVKISKVPR